MCIRPWFFCQDIWEERTRRTEIIIQLYNELFKAVVLISSEFQVKTHLETRKSPHPLRLQRAGEGGVRVSHLSDPGKTKRELQTFELTVPFAAAQLWRGGF